MRAWLVLLALCSCPAKDKAPAVVDAGPPPFWPWFAQNEGRLVNAARNPETGTQIMEEISGHLEHAEPGLIAELAIDADPSRPCGVIISADGKRELFDKVRKVAAAAPKLEHWTVTAFRPRRDPSEELEIGGRTFTVKDFYFRELGKKNGKVDVEVAIRGLTPENHNEVVRAMFIELDTIVGELDAETKIGDLEFVPLPEKVPPELKPLTDIAQVVDAL
jgi:hypothetical protein